MSEIKVKDGKINKISTDDKSELLAQTGEQTTEELSTVTKNFSELINNQNLLEQQYELLYGTMPNNYNELVLVVDKNNTIPLSLAYSLGLEDRNELTNIMKKIYNGENIDIKNSSYDYNGLVGITYKLILPSDYYVKENGAWIDKSTNVEHINQLYNNGIELKVVGIIKEKDNQKNTVKTGFMGYTDKLTEELLSITKEKEIIKNLQVIVQKVIEQERQARKLLAKDELELEDIIYRSYGVLTNCRKISYEEARDLLSDIKLGTDLGILPELTDLKVQKLNLYIKPASLQKYLGKQYEVIERDIKRAEVIKQIINEK